MTSSLVGSEMCIRDRSTELLVALLHAAFDLAIAGENPMSKASHIERMAVSYTHLTLPTICSV
eukprot:311586-Prorocentrum_lima.AAC.1